MERSPSAPQESQSQETTSTIVDNDSTNPDQGYDGSENYSGANSEQETLVAATLRDRIGDKLNKHIEASKYAVDHTLNIKDIALQKATLLNRREVRTNLKALKLEDKLSHTKPGSRKEIRLKRSLIYTKGDLAKIKNRQDLIVNRISGRQHDGDEKGNAIIGAEVAFIQKGREKAQANMQVAIEKKRRRKIEQKVRRTDNSEARTQLRNEIESWPHIDDFKKSLMRAISAKYNQGIN